MTQSYFIQGILHNVKKSLLENTLIGVNKMNSSKYICVAKIDDDLVEYDMMCDVPIENYDEYDPEKYVFLGVGYTYSVNGIIQNYEGFEIPVFYIYNRK
jgi:hypothetical protein